MTHVSSCAVRVVAAAFVATWFSGRAGSAEEKARSRMPDSLETARTPATADTADRATATHARRHIAGDATHARSARKDMVRDGRRSLMWIRSLRGVCPLACSPLLVFGLRTRDRNRTSPLADPAQLTRVSKRAPTNQCDTTNPLSSSRSHILPSLVLGHSSRF